MQPVQPVQVTGITLVLEDLKRVGDALQGGGSEGFSEEQVAEKSGFTLDKVRGALKTIQRDGHAFSVPGGKWRWIG